MATKTSIPTPSITPTFSLPTLLNFFQNNTSKGSVAYSRYVTRIDNICQQVYGTTIVEWFINVITMSPQPKDPIGIVMVQLMNLFANPACPVLSPKTQTNYACGFKKFAQTVIGFFHANIWLTTGNNDNYFCELIARNALFADDSVVKDVIKGNLGTRASKVASKANPHVNRFASWDYMLHYRDTTIPKGTQVPDPKFPLRFPGTLPFKIADDNSYANQYIKKAVIESFNRKYVKGLFNYRSFKDYEACHVWDMPGDRMYYASIMNLVLVPRALAQLTDHNDAVKNLLRYEVSHRFGFNPTTTVLSPPSNYRNYTKLWRKI